MMIETTDLKHALIEELQRSREILGRMKGSKIGEAIADARVQSFEMFLIIIHNIEKAGGVIDMKDVKKAFGKIGKLEELLQSRRVGAGEIQQTIKEWADELKPGAYVEVDPQYINRSTFINTTYKLRKKGDLPPEVKPIDDKKSGKMYLIRMKPGE